MLSAWAPVGSKASLASVVLAERVAAAFGFRCEFRRHLRERGFDDVEHPFKPRAIAVVCLFRAVVDFALLAPNGVDINWRGCRHRDWVACVRRDALSRLTWNPDYDSVLGIGDKKSMIPGEELHLRRPVFWTGRRFPFWRRSVLMILNSRIMRSQAFDFSGRSAGRPSR